MSPEELTSTLRHVEKSLRGNEYLYNIARKNDYDLTNLYPEKLEWEIASSQVKGMETYLYIFTSFMFGGREYARVIIHVKGTNGFCYSSHWRFHFRSKKDPLFTAPLPALFQDFDPPPEPPA